MRGGVGPSGMAAKRASTPHSSVSGGSKRSRPSGIGSAFG